MEQGTGDLSRVRGKVLPGPLAGLGLQMEIKAASAWSEESTTRCRPSESSGVTLSA